MTRGGLALPGGRPPVPLPVRRHDPRSMAAPWTPRLAEPDGPRLPRADLPPERAGRHAARAPNVASPRGGVIGSSDLVRSPDRSPGPHRPRRRGERRGGDDRRAARVGARRVRSDASPHHPLQERRPGGHEDPRGHERLRGLLADRVRGESRPEPRPGARGDPAAGLDRHRPRSRSDGRGAVRLREGRVDLATPGDGARAVRGRGEARPHRGPDAPHDAGPGGSRLLPRPDPPEGTRRAGRAAAAGRARRRQLRRAVRPAVEGRALPRPRRGRTDRPRRDLGGDRPTRRALPLGGRGLGGRHARSLRRHRHVPTAPGGPRAAAEALAPDRSASSRTDGVAPGRVVRGADAPGRGADRVEGPAALLDPLRHRPLRNPGGPRLPAPPPAEQGRGHRVGGRPRAGLPRVPRRPPGGDRSGAVESRHERRLRRPADAPRDGRAGARGPLCVVPLGCGSERGGHGRVLPRVRREAGDAEGGPRHREDARERLRPLPRLLGDPHLPGGAAGRADARGRRGFVRHPSALRAGGPLHRGAPAGPGARPGRGEGPAAERLGRAGGGAHPGVLLGRGGRQGDPAALRRPCREPGPLGAGARSLAHPGARGARRDDPPPEVEGPRGEGDHGGDPRGHPSRGHRERPRPERRERAGSRGADGHPRGARQPGGRARRLRADEGGPEARPGRERRRDPGAGPPPVRRPQGARLLRAAARLVLLGGPRARDRRRRRVGRRQGWPRA
jgi:hypothetical protein